MFEQLWSFIQQFATELIPVARIQPWENGVLMRWHKYRRTLEPGWHFRIPFVESFVECIIVETTDSCPPQSIATRDGKSVTVQANVRYSISDARKFLIDVTDGKNAVLDQCTGVVARIIMSRTWDECRKDIDGLENEVSKETRRLVKRYGVNVEHVTLPTLAIVRTIRLIGVPGSQV
jgi:regulator of protease activity HflC (stomatin/prohibitin superfamily)